jgi:predicted anti-sigma-YlaC factor YlaD
MSAVGRMRECVVGMRTCHEVGRVLQRYLDEELDQARVKKAASHLEHCRRCKMEADTYARIKQSLARVARQGLVHPEDQLLIERLRRFTDTL